MTCTGQFSFPGLLRGARSESSCGGQSSNRRSGKHPRERNRTGPERFPKSKVSESGLCHSCKGGNKKTKGQGW